MSNDFIIKQEVTDRYAKALYDVAQDKGHIEPVLRDLESLEKFAQQNTPYWVHVTSPIVSVEDQKRVVKELADTLHLCQITNNFIEILCINDRLNCLLSVADRYRKILETAQGGVQGVLEVASPLADKDLKKVAGALGKNMGKEVSLRQVVTPEILGGAILKMDSLMVDASLSGRLYKLQQTMKG